MKLKIIIVLLVLVTTGATGWWFMTREPEPQEVIERMVAAMQAATSYEYEGALTAEVDASALVDAAKAEGTLELFVPAEPTFTVTVLASGAVAFDEQQFPHEHRAFFDLYLAPSTGGGAPFSLEAETLFSNEVSYLALNDISLPLPFDFSAVLGNWYEFDDLKKFTELEERKQVITGEHTIETFQTQLQELQALTRGVVFYEVQETLPGAEFEGVMTYHYRVSVDTAAVRVFVDEFLRIFNIDATEKGQEIIEDALGQLQNLTGELWIGEKDFYLYRSVFELPITFALKSSNEPVQITAAVKTNYRAFNEPLNLVVPSDARPQEQFLQDLLGRLLGGVFGDVSGSALPNSGERSELPRETIELILPASEGDSAFEVPVAGDLDGDGLTDIQEKFWGSDPQNPDTDGDGYLDGAEVDQGYSPTGPGRLF